MSPSITESSSGNAFSDNSVDCLAEFVVGTTASDIPADVRDRARMHLIDTLGVAVRGARSPVARDAISALGLTDDGPATVWATGLRGSARDAALANGVAAHALELDDTGGCDHSGAVVVPAVLAAVETMGHAVTGMEVIRAIVMGYELGRRALEACGGYSAHNEAGWHSTGTCGTFGAAAAAGVVMGLDERQMADAIGMAGSFSSGLWAFIRDGAASKRLHAGRAAEGGVLAALLAGKGLSGPRGLFDGGWGSFFTTFAPDTATPEALTIGLGERWRICRCSIKPYASCRSTHSGIDAALELARDHHLVAEDIRSVRIEMSPFLYDMCGGTSLPTVSAAQMSLPYAVAAALVFGRVGLDQYSTECLSDPRAMALLRRIEPVAEPTRPRDAEPRLAVDTTDGRHLVVECGVALGAPANPLTETQLRDKFDEMVSPVLGCAESSRLHDLIAGIETTSDVRQIIGALRGKTDAS